MQSRRGWSEIEDDRLLKIIKKYGTKNWSLISDKLSVGTTFERTGKQCRERWYNHLNPEINNEDWTKEEDQKLFEAHRIQGSKWKQISKLFPGRTDNSIKNHFYSTVRKCLRVISKAKGGDTAQITMKSIKPSVLSKLVENTQLLALVVEVGRIKQRESSTLKISQTVVNRICSELQLTNREYQSKNKQNSELTKKKVERGSSQSLHSLPFQCQEPLQQFPLKIQSQKRQFQPEEVPMKQIFEEFQSHPHERSDFLETHIECKDKQEAMYKDIFTFSTHHPHEVKQQTCRLNSLEPYLNQESCIFEQYQSNFFVSPSCGKRKNFPDLRLLAKVSRNSHPSPSHSSKHEERPCVTVLKQGILKQEPLEINFDPHEFMAEEMNQQEQ